MKKSLAKRLNLPINSEGRATTLNGKNPNGSHVTEYEPTRKQILQATKEIRETWDKIEHDTRLGIVQQPVELVEISIRELMEYAD